MQETTAKLGKPGLRMKDVAARAGVSVMTVSRALSTPDKVSGETLRRVQAAVDAVLYVPNGLAGNLSSRKSKAVGVIVPGINNSLYSSMIEAVSTTLRERGFHLMIADSGLNLENEEKAITSFLASTSPLSKADHTDWLTAVDGAIQVWMADFVAPSTVSCLPFTLIRAPETVATSRTWESLSIFVTSAAVTPPGTDAITSGTTSLGVSSLPWPESWPPAD